MTLKKMGALVVMPEDEVKNCTMSFKSSSNAMNDEHRFFFIQQWHIEDKITKGLPVSCRILSVY